MTQREILVMRTMMNDVTDTANMAAPVVMVPNAVPTSALNTRPRVSTAHPANTTHLVSTRAASITHPHPRNGNTVAAVNITHQTRRGGDKHWLSRQ